ncbi:hypothetical protein GCM10020254_35630 [Streptomyces goshikiensis]
MCLAAAAHIVEHDRFADLGIKDPKLAALIAESWRRRAEQPSLYGRFDLRYDGSGPAKMLEYNADTPHLPGGGGESAVVLDGGPFPRRRPVELPARTARRRLAPAGRAAPCRARCTSRTPRPTSSART